MENIKPLSLIILDGWGVAKANPGNAVSLAKTLFFDELVANYPSRIINASGEAVGLPAGIMGNSEVGHLTLGSGRILNQDLQRINQAIADRSFFSNSVLLSALEHVQKNNSQLHLMGLVSDGRVHSSLKHLQALLDLAQQKNIKQVYVHCFLDGRDTLRDAGKKFVQEIQDYLNKLKLGKIATISGRFYAMDRDNHWERTSQVYNAMVLGQGKTATDPQQAIADSYAEKVFDEEFLPTVLIKDNKPIATVQENDTLIFFNYRPDRARQITKAFVLEEMTQFQRPEKIANLFFAGFTEYETGLPMQIVFSKIEIKNTLGEVLAQHNLQQLRIAETEKYAHVTYFFNGGKETKSVGEEHILIPSPRVDSYAEQPEMSALQIAERVVKEIDKQKYNFILINFANADMVGHTGDLQAAITAIETVDQALKKVVHKILDQKGIALIVADHGNAEKMIDLQTNRILKEHTTNPVPFILVGAEYEGKSFDQVDVPGNDLSILHPSGGLSDVAPTILKLFNLDLPAEMTGQSLL